MGQLRKQTIYSSLIIYAGFLLGAINLLILFPRFLPAEYIGLTKVIQDYSIILTSVASLGFVAPFYRFRPYYDKYAALDKNDLLQLFLIVIHIGMLIVSVLSYIFRETITDYFSARSPLFVKYFFFTLSYGYFLIVYNTLEMYLYTKGVAVLQSFVREIVLRVILFLYLVAVIFKLPLEYFVLLFSFHFVIPIIILGVYIYKKYPSAIGIPFSSTTLKLFPFIASMAGLGIFQSIVNAGVPVIDTLVVGGMVGLSGVANYLIMNYISTFVHVPVRASIGVLGARIAGFWKGNELNRIQSMYQRTSMTYMIFGFFLVTIILLNIDFIQKVIGNNIQLDLKLVGILVFAKLFELSTGLSNVILGYSKRWKLENLISIANILIAIPLNLILVRRSGILGAAWSTLILAVVTFSTRLFILKKAYGLFPFKWSTVVFAGTGLALFVVFYWVCGQFESVYIRMLWTLLFVIVFLSFVILSGFSEDINSVFHSVRIRIKARFF